MSIPLSSNDPKVLTNLSRCFFSCVPSGFYLPLRTFQHSQIAIQTNPSTPCNAPTPPQILAVQTLNNVQTALFVHWRQPRNTGAFITGYTLQWGTVSGGPYTGSSHAGAAMRAITIGPLIPGTTYFVVITANSFNGCNSALSSEASGTTSGSAPTTLLTSILGYWKFDEAVNGANAADATGNGWTGTNINVTTFGTGLINGGAVPQGNGGFSVNSGILANTPTTSSFSVQCWVLGPSGGNNSAIIGQVLPNVYWDLFYLAAGNALGFQVHNNADTNFQLNSTKTLVPGGWHHIVFGFDAPNSQIWIRCDLETRQTLGGITSVKRTADQVVALGNYSTFVGPSCPNNFDEFAIWNRVLTDAEVVSLNNGGAGLPFSQFGSTP